MTAAVEPAAVARLSEGWCPHPAHGRLAETGAGEGYCAACDAQWSQAPCGLPALQAMVVVGDSQAAMLVPYAALRSAAGQGALIDVSVRTARRDARSQPGRG